MTLELRLCGELQLLRDGQPLELPPSRKTRALLAYLVMNEREHRRKQLVDLLWDVADDPRGGLRWCLSKLRALLDDAEHTRVVADRDSIRLDAAALRVDAKEIFATRIESASVAEFEARCAELHGEFCEGLDLHDHYGFHAWCVGQRQDLGRRHVRMRRRLVTLLAEQPDDALRHLRALCQLVPHDEGVHAEQVQLLAALGHAREAAEYQRSARSLLSEQHGVRETPALDRALSSQRSPAGREPPAPPSAMARHREPPRQQIRFCTSADGTGIAWAEVGSGPPLVKVANWISHLEHEHRSPVWCHMIRELSRENRLVRYDQRGNGLSDRKVSDLSGPRHLEDLEAVMDAAQCERVPLLGISQGCAIAVEYAVRHPERVSHLILYGGFAVGWRRHSASLREAGNAMTTIMRTGWGGTNPAFRQLWTALFLPHAQPEATEWFNEMQRVASDGATAADLVLAIGDYDVRDQLPDVACPTLVMHLEGDQMIPFAEGKRLAAGIPGARFVPLSGENHIPLEADACFPQIIAEIRQFLAGEAASR
jgi:pimeloyl-ACP methyl ester carboxylesterase/DNA-binding SARP family transcriptional activator